MTRTEMGNEQPTSTSILIRIVTYDYLSKKAGTRARPSADDSLQFRYTVTCCGSPFFASSSSEGCCSMVRPIRSPGVQISLM